MWRKSWGENETRMQEVHRILNEIIICVVRTIKGTTKYHSVSIIFELQKFLNDTVWYEDSIKLICLPIGTAFSRRRNVLPLHLFQHRCRLSYRQAWSRLSWNPSGLVRCEETNSGRVDIVGGLTVWNWIGGFSMEMSRTKKKLKSLLWRVHKERGIWGIWWGVETILQLKAKSDCELKEQFPGREGSFKKRISWEEGMSMADELRSDLLRRYVGESDSAKDWTRQKSSWIGSWNILFVVILNMTVLLNRWRLSPWTSKDSRAGWPVKTAVLRFFYQKLLVHVICA